MESIKELEELENIIELNKLSKNEELFQKIRPAPINYPIPVGKMLSKEHGKQSKPVTLMSIREHCKPHDTCNIS